MARSQYALPAETKPNRDDPRGLSAYIRETAKKYGVDPEVALRVAKSEGLRSFRSGVRTKSGGEEPSFGAFQLYTGGGEGNRFQKETGLDPADPKNEKATIDYALRRAAKVGWGPWHGAKNTGIGEWEGISGGAGKGAQTQTAVADAAGGPAEGGVDIKGADTSTVAPDVAQNAPTVAAAAPAEDWLSKLKNPQGNASAGLGEAIAGLGAATTGASKGNLYDAPARPMVPIAPTPPPPQVVPMVDPRTIENQRQQLALAMQRLNSGRLY